MKKFICIVLIMSMILPIYGCGSNSKNADVCSASADEKNGEYYIHTELSGVDKNINGIKAVHAGLNIVAYGTDSTQNTVFYVVDTNSMTVKPIEGLSKYSIVDIAGLNDGAVVILSVDEDGENIISKLDTNGKVSDLIKIKPSLIKDDVISGITPVKNGWLIKTTSKIIFLDEFGEHAKNLGSYSGAMDIMNDSDGNLILINTLGNSVDAEFSDRGVKVVELDDKLNEKKTYSLANDYSCYFDTYEGQILARSYSTIYLVNYKNDTREALIDAQMSKLDSKCLLAIGDDKFFSFYNGEPFVWKKSSLEETRVLTLAAYNLKPELYNAVVEFNSTNEEYIINIVDYASCSGPVSLTI
ncbi:MAG: hypothetical protein ACOX68_07875 [Candidatus Limivicinus sp.]|jgi:hypothetical protein